MRVLFWGQPWPVGGNFFFHQKSVKSVLSVQANALSDLGCSVDFALPAHFTDVALSSRVQKILLKTEEILLMSGRSIIDPYKALYQGTRPDFEKKIADYLRTILAPDYDVIMCWETPIPFLEKLYPDALTIH